MEFAEHRDYVAGDDLRHLDWSALARHERLVIKEFESELERTVLVVVDLSASMGESKAALARQVAAGLGWVALVGQDRLALATLGGGVRYHPPVRGRAQWGQTMNWLREAPLGGRADLSSSLRSLAQRLPRASLMLVVSDWLEPDAEQALAFPHYCRHQLVALQILDEADRDPPWMGPLRLEDSETREVREISLDDATRVHYQKVLRQHCADLAESSRRRGFGHLLWSSEDPLEDLLLRQLVRQGWLV